MKITIYREKIDEKKKIFKYTDKHGEVVKDKKILEYIEKLRIPPAYTDVEIFYNTNGTVPNMLFFGYDSKLRKQQIYSAKHREKADRKKFKALIEFGKTLPRITMKILENIRSPGLTKNKIISIILRIITLCGFRVGSEKYQKLYNSIGLSTLMKKHLKFKDNTLEIKFIGKKGVQNDCIIKDTLLINEIHKLVKNKTCSDYIFTYENPCEPNESVVITGLDINKWLKQYNPEFTTKYFRTFDVNCMLIELLNSTKPSKMSLSERKKKIVELMKKVSCQINNTAAICKKSYVNGDLLKLYIEHPKKYETTIIKDNMSPRVSFIKFLEKTYK